MKTVVLGATGMLGSYIKKYLSEQSIDIVCIDRSIFDVLNDDINKLFELLNVTNEDIVINCIGIIPQKSNNIREQIIVNTLFPIEIERLQLKIGFKFIHISTDCVFDGKIGKYTEDDTHTSNDIYGITKSLGEPKTSCVIRTSIIGEELYHKKSLLEWVLSSKNSSISGYTNHLWNGVTCLELSKFIYDIIKNNLFWTGVRHVFTNDIISKYTLCEYINQIYKLNINIIPTENDISKNMTIASNYNNVINKSIYQQIYEQMVYDKIKDRKIGEYTLNKNCRFCDSELKSFFNFDGLYPLAGGFLQKDEFELEYLYPLSLSQCDNCCTFQCDQVVNKDLLFKNGYFYYSSTIPYLAKHFSEYSKLLESQYYNNSCVKTILEMGCNDGVLLRKLKDIGFNVIGIDPSETIEDLVKDGFNIYNDYFNEYTANEIVNNNGKVDIFLSSNSFAHIDNMKTIINGIKIVLKEDGIAIIEVHNTDNIIKNLNFDFIYHEHMTYYSKESFYKIFENFGMLVEKIEDIDVHGGSIRVYIRNTKPTNIHISNMFLSDLSIFKQRLFKWKNDFLDIFYTLKKENKRIWGYGASGRTNIMLSFLGIELDEIVDDMESKIGAFMPISHKEIKNSCIIYKENPDYIIILAWPYTDNIVTKHKNFKGKFIVPLPNIILDFHI